MSAERSRFVAFWASAEMRARIWFSICLLEALALYLSLLTTNQLLHKPREVIRIAGDGIPAVVRLDDIKYSEPNEAEVRAFATNFVRLYARADSGSVVNDYAWCGQHMAPKLRVQFVREVKMTRATAMVQGLKTRADIDPSGMKIEVDTSGYPWRVKVAAVRHSVTELGSGAPSQAVEQAVEVELELVKTPRSEVIEGLLVWKVQTSGGPVGAPSGRVS